MCSRSFTARDYYCYYYVINVASTRGISKRLTAWVKLPWEECDKQRLSHHAETRRWRCEECIGSTVLLCGGESQLRWILGGLKPAAG